MPFGVLDQAGHGFVRPTHSAGLSKKHGGGVAGGLVLVTQSMVVSGINGRQKVIMRAWVTLPSGFSEPTTAFMRHQSPAWGGIGKPTMIELFDYGVRLGNMLYIARMGVCICLL